ncbi:MAG: hypothetical protein ACO3IB_11460 [Phycisphaerales bacterium]
MAEETKVRVKLDTAQAKGELGGLTREAARTAGKVAAGIRATVGRGLGAIVLGAGIGTGLAAGRGATESGVSEVGGESLGGVGAQLADFFLGTLNEDARASKAAREETIQAFGAIAGAQNRVPPGAKAFFDSVKTLRVQEERGRELFEKDERFRGPGVVDMIDRIMKGVAEMVSAGVDQLAEKLNPFK